MKILTEHEINKCNQMIAITRPSTAPVYIVAMPNAGGDVREVHSLQFQAGAVEEVGLNGITNEVLLAIVLDRLRIFQDGAARCRENAIVITKLEEALMWLRKRADDHEARGVEGAPKP